MQGIPPRIVIYTKDVMNITGRKERTARKLLSEIRKQQGKKQTDFITVEEFCQYTGLREEKIYPFLLS
jgi:hypothetical protein